MILGVKIGFITFILDVYKVVFAIILIKLIFPASNNFYLYAALSAVLGHIFPFYLNFKGGKGVASFLGIFVGINFQLGFILGLFLFCFAFITNYISLTGIFLYLIGPVLIYLITWNMKITIYASIVCLIGIFKHGENIKNIKAGKEKKVRKFIIDKLIKKD